MMIFSGAFYPLSNGEGFLWGLRPRLLVTLSPLSPSPYQGEGEELVRGVAPLLDTPLVGGGGISKG